MPKPTHLVAAAAAAALVGCAAPDGAYPSLSVRETERVSGTLAAPPTRAYEPPPVPAEDLTQGDQLVSRAKAAHQSFLDAAPPVRDIVRAAQGASQESESWARAQVAIADLESRRAELMFALADLDRLTVDAAVQGEQFGPLAQKRDEISALADNETQLINALLESLAR